MKSRAVMNVLCVAAALVIGWIWVVRPFNLAWMAMGAIAPVISRDLPLNVWPKAGSMDGSETGLISKETQKWPTRSQLINKRQLTDDEKKLLAFYTYRGKNDVKQGVDLSSYSPIPKVSPVYKAGERLDPDNGLYPLFEAVARLHKAAKERQLPKLPTQKKIPYTYDITDYKQLSLAIDAFQRASSLPIQYHRTELMGKVLFKDPTLAEYYLVNSTNIVLGDEFSVNHAIRDSMRAWSRIGPKLVKSGHKQEAIKLTNALLPFAKRYTQASEDSIIDLMVSYVVIQYALDTESEMSKLLGLPDRSVQNKKALTELKAVYKYIKKDMNKPSPENGGTVASLTGTLFMPTPTPKQLAIGRMTEYTLADEAALTVLVAVWLLALWAGICRLSVWLTYRSAKTAIPELNMNKDYRNAIIWWMIVPLAAYALLTASANMPWRSHNISDSTYLEKGVMIALLVIAPWIRFRFLFKQKWQKTSLPTPSRAFELLANWLPLIGAVPLLVVILIDTASPNNANNTGLVISAVVWMAAAIYTMRFKRSYSAYYTAAARYLLPLFAWSTLAISVIFMPIYLGREVSMLKRDEIGLGMFKHTGYTTVYDYQAAQRYTPKVMEVLNHLR